MARQGIDIPPRPAPLLLDQRLNPRGAIVSRTRWLRVITSTVSSPAMVPMISAQPAWSSASVIAPAEPLAVLSTSSGPTPSTLTSSAGSTCARSGRTAARWGWV